MPTRTTCLPARTPAAAAGTSVLICVGTFLFAAADLAAQPPAPKLSGQALVDKYCAGCHNDKRASGGFSSTTIDLADPGRSAHNAERVVRRLRSGLMPP